MLVFKAESMIENLVEKTQENLSNIEKVCKDNDKSYNRIDDHLSAIKKDSGELNKWYQVVK